MGNMCGRHEEESQEKRINLLLLGAPGVGKSTIFKQLKMLYNSGFSDEFRAEMLPCIRHNAMLNLKNAADLVKQSGGDLAPHKSAIDHIDALVAAEGDDEKGPVLVNDEVIELSKNQNIVEILTRIREGTDTVESDKLQDAGCYYIERLEEIAKDDYTPTDLDILSLRRVTDKAEPILFDVPMEWPPNSREMRNICVSCTDVGGQSHHEYDWVHHGADCDAILFVVTLSHFHRVDGEGRNELKEQLNMLRRVANAEAFSDKQIVLLLNKNDLLENQLKKHQFGDYFKKYTGSNTMQDVVEHFSLRCRKILKEKDESRDSSIVRTCALDSTLMEQVLTKVLLALFRSILKETWAA